MEDTKIVGRINCAWAMGSGSDSSPIFEGDTHEFNADGLKRHRLEIATGSIDPEDVYTYEIYTKDGLKDCTLKELFKATHPHMTLTDCIQGEN